MSDPHDGAPIRPDPDADRDLTMDPAAKSQPAEGGRAEAEDAAEGGAEGHPDVAGGEAAGEPGG